MEWHVAGAQGRRPEGGREGGGPVYRRRRGRAAGSRGWASKKGRVRQPLHPVPSTQTFWELSEERELGARELRQEKALGGGLSSAPGWLPSPPPPHRGTSRGSNR